MQPARRQRHDLAGRQVLVVHGTDDRIALPSRSAELARRLGRDTTVGHVSVPGGRHAMLRHGRTFETYAADFVTATLLAAEPRTRAVAEVLAGASSVDG